MRKGKEGFKRVEESEKLEEIREYNEERPDLNEQTRKADREGGTKDC